MWISGVAAPSFDYSESSGYGHPSFTDGSKVWTLSRKLSSVKKRDDDCPRGLLSGPMTIGLGKNCQLLSLKLPAAMWIWCWSPHQNQNFAGNDIDSKENITGKLWNNERVCWYVCTLSSFPCSQSKSFHDLGLADTWGWADMVLRRWLRWPYYCLLDGPYYCRVHKTLGHWRSQQANQRL